jgi:hypothetical protein
MPLLRLAAASPRCSMSPLLPAIQLTWPRQLTATPAAPNTHNYNDTRHQDAKRRKVCVSSQSPARCRSCAAGLVRGAMLASIRRTERLLCTPLSFADHTEQAQDGTTQESVRPPPPPLPHAHMRTHHTHISGHNHPNSSLPPHCATPLVFSHIPRLTADGGTEHRALVYPGTS